MENILTAGPTSDTTRLIYHIEVPVPKSVFCKNYPENPRTFGEHLRKARIDAGLLIKDLAKQIGVNENSATNWEARGRIPRGKNREALKRIFSDCEKWVDGNYLFLKESEKDVDIALTPVMAIELPPTPLPTV